jgi:isorenieratene synthase
MKRARGLVEFSRRDFCAFAACGIALLGCTDGGVDPVHTGALGGGDDQAPPVDAKGGDSGNGGTDSGVTHTDGGVSNPDASAGPTCSGSPIDVGLPSAFQVGTPVYFSGGRLFVVKDAGGYYAVSSLCTHEGATNVVSSGKFRCPRHGALFQFDGTIVSGPVNKPLVHYAMCTMANGHIGVTTATKVPATDRYNP